jgi:chromosome partitioning protein
MPTLAVVSHKGGSGKTTIAANLAAALAEGGAAVLLIDADPQGAAGAALGADTSEPNLAEVLYGRAGVAAIRRTAFANLSIIPSDDRLAGVELTLPKMRTDDWQQVMRQALRPLLRPYAFTIIDTGPGLAPLPFMSLTAADGALVACPPQFLAYRALPEVMKTIEQVRHYNRGLELIGIVPTMVTRQSRHEREVLDALTEDYPGKVLTEIPRRVALADAQVAGEPITDFAPTSDAAQAFAQLAQEVQRAR